MKLFEVAGFQISTYKGRWLPNNVTGNKGYSGIEITSFRPLVEQVLLFHDMQGRNHASSRHCVYIVSPIARQKK